MILLLLAAAEQEQLRLTHPQDTRQRNMVLVLVVTLLTFLVWLASRNLRALMLLATTQKNSWYNSRNSLATVLRARKGRTAPELHLRKMICCRKQPEHKGIDKKGQPQARE